MIASLGMYDRAQTASANDRFWGEIRDGLRRSGLDAPQYLNRETPFWEAWTSPDLLFSQTCGRPYRLQLHATTQLIGTPDYGLPDCAPGYYHSVFVVRARDARTELADFANARFAYNEEMSQSGWAAPLCHVATLGFQFIDRLKTGGHAASARAVVEHAADIAALDALTWEMIKRYEDFSLDLRVIARTEPSPGLPYITGKTANAAGIAQVVAAAIESLDLADRRILRLKGLVQIPAAAYLAVPNP